MSESLCLGRDRLGASGKVYLYFSSFSSFLKDMICICTQRDLGFLASVSVLSIKRARQMAYSVARMTGGHEERQDYKAMQSRREI